MVKQVPAKVTKPGLNPASAVWTSKRGVELHIRGVNASALYALQADTKGRPQVPKQVVTYGGGEQAVEDNPDEPRYLEALKAWERGRAYRTMVYAMSQGIDIEVPQEFVEGHREFFPDAKAGELKYLYVSSLIGADELEPLVDAIIGQEGVTEAGIEASATFLPGNRKRA